MGCWEDWVLCVAGGFQLFLRTAAVSASAELPKHSCCQFWQAGRILHLLSGPTAFNEQILPRTEQVLVRKGYFRRLNDELLS